MSIKVKEITTYLENLYPLSLAEDYDNVGLLIGYEDKIVNKILITLDITTDTVKYAIDNNIDLIISHHPIILKSIKKIDKKNYITSMIYDLIKNDINVYALHTNYDINDNGMNDILATKLNLKEISVLFQNKIESLYKLIVYVPVDYAEEVSSALFRAGAGHIGNYDMCSFNLKGKGTFRPLEGSNPFIGNKNIMESVDEIRIETIVREKDLKQVINALLKTHPYEEPAYDIIKLENKIYKGIGRIGILEKTVKAKDVANELKEKLNLNFVVIIGDTERQIRKVAIVGGAGGDLIHIAKNKGCDLIITGDVKHHVAIEALEDDIVVLDATHFGLEQVFIEHIKTLLNNSFNSLDIHTIYTKQPYNFI
ncbi:Nif3-like dinuclear metal center hexameric protein [Thermobrachium celere]|uniref:Nif3-like dinuclear metal center hexameric protein n=1 Tax=Thermobrachium celere TaxID=53422 RepID=UPI0019431935|nr:Nif3-like dinuclear metal center hexameric protein [Thermobrachium celere]GFR36117.1 GTP cyclohydrolase 1 type 2 [Thermobrachium celere]